MAISIGRHLALAWFLLLIQIKKSVSKSVGGSALANLSLHKRGQCVDIILVSKSSARIDLQASEMILFGQADLKNAEIALQVLLLIDDQLQPATLDRGDGVAGHIKASGEYITRFLANGFQEGLDGAG